MRAIFILIWILLFGFSVSAQKVEWASRVLEVSSEPVTPQYSSIQILHKPDVLPGFGDSPNAWMPEKKSRNEFVKVAFDCAMKIQQIAIAESFNPGSVSRIYLYDRLNKEYLLNAYIPKPLDLKGRLHRIFFDKTSFEVFAVKVVFDVKAVGKDIAIDAIGISDSKIPISIDKNITTKINKEWVAERLDSNVNSPYKELKPLLSTDGKTMYFSRRNHPENTGGKEDDEDIWYSEMNDFGKWEKAKLMANSLNNAGPNFISSITADGDNMILILGNQYKRKRMTSGVSISKRTSLGWSEPVQIEIKKFYNLSDKADFFLANNKKTLLMAIERTDTYGFRDLYVSFLQDNGEWTEPKNIGSVVNSGDDETAPFLALDDKTLYFSAKSLSGFGGYDVYMTRRLDDTWLKWSEPENLGSNINSEEDDIFFNMAESDEYAYFCRGNGIDADIYKTKLHQYQKPDVIVAIRGKVLNAKTKAPLGAKIKYERLPEGTALGIASSDSVTGKYRIILPVGANYGYFVNKRGFIPVSDHIDLTNIKDDTTELERDIYLMPMEVGSPIVINNIFFEFDKADLLPASFSELDRLTSFLYENPGMVIEVGGHTCDLGSDQYNQNLSQRRAQSVYNYFIKKGIEPERLKYVGYGEARPLMPNTSEPNREKNRRVEFLILKDGKIG
jgi:OmpA-OmpF porin, OOP family